MSIKVCTDDNSSTSSDIVVCTEEETPTPQDIKMCMDDQRTEPDPCLDPPDLWITGDDNPFDGGSSPGDTTTYTATGGAGGYEFFATSECGTVSINSSTGVVTHGSEGGQGVVTVTDICGTNASLEVRWPGSWSADVGTIQLTGASCSERNTCNAPVIVGHYNYSNARAGCWGRQQTPPCAAPALSYCTVSNSGDTGGRDADSLFSAIVGQSLCTHLVSFCPSNWGNCMTGRAIAPSIWKWEC